MTRDVGVPPPGYRLPDATHVGRVRLQVSDLARSLEYYERTLGLRLLARDAGSAVLGAADTSNALVVLVERPRARRAPRHGRLGLYHFAILLPDRAALGRFVVHLAEKDVVAASADHLVSEALYLWDPDGLGIEVYADRPRDTWRAVGRELAMATEPLDLRALAAAAVGRAWSGMPEGTTMGHVHLHVGDLDRAEAFYHRALGFDKMVWTYPGALFMSAGGYHHHLGTNTWARGAASATGDDARLLEWELVLPAVVDVEAGAANLRNAGRAVVLDDVDCLVDDDWGTRLRLTASR